MTIVLLFRPNWLRSQRLNFFPLTRLFSFVDTKVFIKVIDKERPYEASEGSTRSWAKKKLGQGK